MSNQPAASWVDTRLSAEIVLRRYPEGFFQGGLDRISKLDQACFIVTAFVDVDLGEWHCRAKLESG
jgi:hypothetical protein